MPQTDEQTISQALADYNNGIFSSYRAAGRAYNVPHTTLLRRNKGQTTTRSDAHEDQFLLSKDLESRLVEWILYCETCRFPLCHRQIKEFVSLILKTIGNPIKPGQKWVSRFIQRHPELASKIGQKIDSECINNANEEVLRPWFDDLAALKTKLYLTIDNT